MKLDIYTIRDRVAGAYLQPFFTHTKGTAIRSLLAELQRPDCPLAQNPGDYDLYYLGVWQDSDGRILADADNSPVHVIAIADLLPSASVPGVLPDRLQAATAGQGPDA